MSMSDAELGRIEARLAAATPGPLEAADHHHADRPGVDGWDAPGEFFFLTAPGDAMSVAQYLSRADAALFAAAPADLRALLDDLKRVRADLEVRHAQVHDRLQEAASPACALCRDEGRRAGLLEAAEMADEEARRHQLREAEAAGRGEEATVLRQAVAASLFARHAAALRALAPP